MIGCSALQGFTNPFGSLIGVGRQKHSDEWTASSGAEMTSASHKAVGLAYYQHVVVEGWFEEIPHDIGESAVEHNRPNDAPTEP